MALIQQTPRQRASGASLALTFTDAFATVPTAGNDVLLVVNWYGPLPSQVFIAGEEAELDAEYNPSDQYRVLVYRARLDGSNNRHITFNGSGTVYVDCAAMEVDPLADDPVDQYTQGAFAYGANTAVSVSTANPTTQAEALVIAQWTCFDEDASVGPQSPASTGYTSLFAEDDHTLYMGGEASFKFVSATGVQSASWTNTYTGYRIPHIITYKLGAAPTPDDDIAGDAALSFGLTGTLRTRARLSGNAGMGVAASAAARARIGMSGNAGMGLATSGSVRAAARLSGAAALAITATGATRARGRLAGDAGLSFAATGALRATAGMSGTAGFGFALAGDLVVELDSAVSGDARLVFGASGSLRARARMSGNAGLALTTTGTVSARARLSGDAALGLEAAGTLRLPTLGLSGVAAIGITTSAIARSRGRLRGTAGLGIGTDGPKARARARLRGDAGLGFALEAGASPRRRISGAAAIGFGVSGTLSVRGVLRGNAGLTLGAAATARARGRMRANARLRFVLRTYSGAPGPGVLVGSRPHEALGEASRIHSPLGDAARPASTLLLAERG